MFIRVVCHSSRILSFTVKKVFNSTIGNQRYSLFGSMKIGTHDGIFHCDEVLACYMLKCLPEYKDAEIVRTRDMEKLSGCDIVVDVGSVFDHEKRRYDHHQREFTETLSSLRPELGDKYKIRLSSAGLVYTYYGERVIQEVAPKEATLTPDNLKMIYKTVYENLIEEIDAIDNGVPISEDEPKYKIHTHLSSRVHRLNVKWNCEENDNVEQLFQRAMKLVSEEFLYVVNNYINVTLPARDIVRTAVENRFHIHKSGKIIVLEQACPWKDHLFLLETELGIENEIKYALFNDNGTMWRVQAVPVAPASFVLRIPLHKNWWGVRDEVLSQVAGIDGCKFCHATGFIGGNLTKEGALQMAIASLEADTE